MRDATDQWLFDELRHAGSEHLDPEYVAGYDRKARTDVSDDVALLRQLGLNADSTVVDIGAGTGTFALAVAPLCERVIAIDVSPPMLNALRTKLEAAGVTNVECVRAGFLTHEQLPATADFVYSRNALHHLPDFWKAIALERVAELLRPGGILRLRDLVYSFSPARTDEVFEAWLAQAPLNADEGWTRDELETHIRDEYSTFNWLLEPMLQQAGFAIEAVTHSSSKVFSAYTCRKS